VRGVHGESWEDDAEGLDETVAELKLKAMGVKIDELTPEQKRYLATWEMGTT